jgi:hypothetical protein
MTKKFDNHNRGALFNNRADKKSDEDRDYAGTINIEGIDYWLSGWLKTSKKGQKYLALAAKMKEAKSENDDDF